MLTPRNCYVVERHDPHLAETTIEGVYDARTTAWERVVESLSDEKLTIDQAASADCSELEIVESPCADTRQTYYALEDRDGHEFVGFYITEVPYNE